MIAPKDKGDEEHSYKDTAAYSAGNDPGRKLFLPENPEADKDAKKKQRGTDREHSFYCVTVIQLDLARLVPPANWAFLIEVNRDLYRSRHGRVSYSMIPVSISLAQQGPDMLCYADRLFFQLVRRTKRPSQENNHPQIHPKRRMTIVENAQPVVFSPRLPRTRSVSTPLWLTISAAFLLAR